MEMTARLTGDAVVSTLQNHRQVANFSVAINDSYRVKGKNEPVKIVSYVQCDYWVNTAIAPYLTKGKLVELQGHIGVHAYQAKNGEPKATFTLHVNSIKLHGGEAAKNETPVIANSEPAASAADDLPF
jgi:single-strand DNA-binding protein